MRLSAGICTANIAAVPDGGWALISPYGDHPSPDGSYSQHFDRAQAEQVVRTWNSIPGKAARAFKNLWHKRGTIFSVPVWDGHPDSDKARWPQEKLLAEVTDLRAGAEGLEGLVTWNARGLTRRTAGPLYPSALWWHWPASGQPAQVFPELLESIGLVPTPNITSVPAWTQNATLSGSGGDDADPAEEPKFPEQTENSMTPEQLAELRKALGLPETADAATCITTSQLATANAAKLTEQATALQTANSASAALETRLTTATSQVSTLTVERDGLNTTNTELSTANAALMVGALDLAEKHGHITPAERPAFQTKLSTANSAAATLTELKTRKAMNTTAVEINGNRVDLSTANSRQSALEAAVTKHMKDASCDRDTAFAAVSSNPAFAALFGAMQDPSKTQ